MDNYYQRLYIIIIWKIWKITHYYNTTYYYVCRKTNPPSCCVVFLIIILCVYIPFKFWMHYRGNLAYYYYYIVIYIRRRLIEPRLNDNRLRVVMTIFGRFWLIMVWGVYAFVANWILQVYLFTGNARDCRKHRLTLTRDEYFCIKAWRYLRLTSYSVVNCGRRHHWLYL